MDKKQRDSSILQAVDAFEKDDNLQLFIESVCTVLGKKVPQVDVDYKDGNSVCSWLLDVVHDVDELVNRMADIIERIDGSDRSKEEMNLDLCRRLFTLILENEYGLEIFQRCREVMGYFVEIIIYDRRYYSNGGLKKPCDTDPRSVYETAANIENLIKLGWCKHSFIAKLMRSKSYYRAEYVEKIFLKWRSMKSSIIDRNRFILRGEWIELTQEILEMMKVEKNSLRYLELLARVKPILDSPLGDGLRNEITDYEHKNTLKTLGTPCLFMWKERKGFFEDSI